MKLLLFSDLHEDIVAAERIAGLAAQADVVIGAGDFGNMRSGVHTCFRVLRAIRIPAILVPGNNESYDELLAACSGWPSARVLHGNGLELMGQPFFGIGGGIPTTPFGDWSFDLSEAEATKMLANCPERAVLISHSPPKGAVDVSSSGGSLGSTAVRDAIIRTRPRLVVCGHIHASSGQRAQIADTTIINAGSQGLLVEL